MESDFKNLHLKIKYDSDEDDIVNDFYIPILQNSISYKRIAGFFSSSSLAIASRGIFGLIKNGGKMQLLTSSYLNKDDIDVIKNHIKTKEQVISENFHKELEKIEDTLEHEHLKALGWMLQNNFLEIKIVDLLDDENQIISGESQSKIGMFHMKIGIFNDGKNLVSFSGSINESATGWLHSIEEIKIFKEWLPGQQEYVYEDLKEFEKFWENKSKKSITYDLPDAVKNELIKIAPKNLDDISIFYPNQKKSISKISPEKIQLRPHQKAAIDAWIHNKFKGILAMATGSGKTITSLFASDLSPKSTITIICTPTIPLIEQWKSEIKRFEPSANIITAGTSKSDWTELLGPKLAPYRLGSSLEHVESRTFVLCTNNTASEINFINFWNDIPSEHIQIISDEVHHLGAEYFQNIFKINSSRRLGLSATPDRQWDDQGNQKIFDYFGKTIYEYNLQQSINDGFLSHYTYHILYAEMNHEEFDKYHELTKSIIQEWAIYKQKEKISGNVLPLTKSLKKLLQERAIIKKKTFDKINQFELWCKSISQKRILVFCEDTEQMEELIKILNKSGKRYVKYKSDMNTYEKTESLNLFKEAQIELLLAIRCLDEGLDVPDCSACLIVSSSTSMREFVQRRGRVLRVTDTNKVANVYDVLVVPPHDYSDDQKDSVHSMLETEIQRVKIMADSADNRLDVISEIRQKLDYYDYFGDII